MKSNSDRTHWSKYLHKIGAKWRFTLGLYEYRKMLHYYWTQRTTCNENCILTYYLFHMVENYSNRLQKMPVFNYTPSFISCTTLIPTEVILLIYVIMFCYISFQNDHSVLSTTANTASKTVPCAWKIFSNYLLKK